MGGPGAAPGVQGCLHQVLIVLWHRLAHLYTRHQALIGKLTCEPLHAKSTVLLTAVACKATAVARPAVEGVHNPSGRKTYQVRWNWAVPWLRRRETSLATLGFSATFSTRRGMGWTLGLKPPSQASVRVDAEQTFGPSDHRLCEHVLDLEACHEYQYRLSGPVKPLKMSDSCGGSTHSISAGERGRFRHSFWELAVCLPKVITPVSA